MRSLGFRPMESRSLPNDQRGEFLAGRSTEFMCQSNLGLASS
jgi:hypothetical protein